jgi:hypothetical protein
MGECNMCADLWENTKERDKLPNLGVDGRIILKCLLKKRDGITVRTTRFLSPREKTAARTEHNSMT